MNITDILQQQLSGPVLEQLTRQIGAKDTRQTASAASGIMNLLLGAMAQNAKKPGGADSLAKALDRDHDGSLLGNIIGMLGGEVQGANAKSVNGASILQHILGARQSGAADTIAKASGLSSQQVGTLMVTLAPMVMAALGKTKKDQKMAPNDLAGMLGGLMNPTSGKKKQTDPTMAMINAFLDKNKDGSIADDLMRMGSSFLGKIRGKK
jgi:hypothetical protein